MLYAVANQFQVPVRVTGGDEHRDTEGDDDHHRSELGPLAPHVPPQLAQKNPAHHSSSPASTGCSTRSSLAIAPECRRTTRSAIRAITELRVTNSTVWWPSRARSRNTPSTCRPVSRIEAAGRLVAQHQRRLLHQRPSDRDPLLLTARQLRREPVHDIREPYPPERRPATGFGVAAGDLREQLDILERGQGDQLKNWNTNPTRSRR